MAAVSRAISVARSLACFLRRSPIRSFGAAAVQLEYESDDEYEFDRLRGAAGLPDACGEKEGRSVQWVFMGSPGDQRHVYANQIAMLLGVPYISMGSLVRKELHPLSNLYKQIANAVNEGKLVPEDIIFGLLSQRLEEGHARGERGFILDGIPRTRVQAEILEQVADIDLVVNLKCNDDCSAKKRLRGGICSSCGASDDGGVGEYAAARSFSPTRTQRAQLEVAAGFDDAEALGRKLQLHVEQNKLLEDYYRNQRKLLDFHVSGSARETWQGLLAALQLQHIDAVNSSPTLTA